MTGISLERVAQTLLSKGLSLATAESCTGGWVAKRCTDLTGSSEWFDLSIVTYSNDAKMALLGVTEGTLSEHGAVSEQTVTEMVTGLLEKSSAHIGLAVSGIAGPGGGSDEKPVGTVWFAWCRRGSQPVTSEQLFEGDRDAVRRQAVEHALEGVLSMLERA